jgi:chromosome segregation ATPase
MAAQQIFKLELLHSLGINDAATCESILSFVNGCSSFASEDLKRSLHIMVSVLQRRVDDSAALVKDHEDLQRSSETEIDKLRKERDTLKSDVTRLNNALAEFDSIKEKSASDIKELKTRNKALVDQVKTLTTEVKTKTSNFEELRKRIVAEFGVQISDQKNTYEKKLSEENASFLERFNTLRSEIEKRNDELSSMQISLESAQRDTASAKKECARLANVNKRLDGRVAALQALPSVGNKRLSADEARDQLEAKIAAISAQSDKAVQEALDEASDLREAVRKAEATKNLELVSANFTISEQKKIIDAQTAEIAEVKAHYNGIALRMKVRGLVIH